MERPLYAIWQGKTFFASGFSGWYFCYMQDSPFFKRVPVENLVESGATFYFAPRKEKTA